MVTFLFIRFSVRMIRAGVSWWPGNVGSGGVHVHHVVFGIVFMLLAGAGGFSSIGNDRPFAEIFAGLFGCGAALVLDEFALVLHLRDVYWAEQGRTSVDAVFLAAAVLGLLLLGVAPLGVDETDPNTSTPVAAYASAILFNGAFVLRLFSRQDGPVCWGAGSVVGRGRRYPARPSVFAVGAVAIQARKQEA